MAAIFFTCFFGSITNLKKTEWAKEALHRTAISLHFIGTGYGGRSNSSFLLFYLFY